RAQDRPYAADSVDFADGAVGLDDDLEDHHALAPGGLRLLRIVGLLVRRHRRRWLRIVGERDGPAHDAAHLPAGHAAVGPAFETGGVPPPCIPLDPPAPVSAVAPP